jgi:hypothetical protein
MVRSQTISFILTMGLIFSISSMQTAKGEALVEIYDTMKIYDTNSKEVKKFYMTSFPYINDVSLFYLFMIRQFLMPGVNIVLDECKH